VYLFTEEVRKASLGQSFQLDLELHRFCLRVDEQNWHVSRETKSYRVESI
jgi:hypothetical protein